MSGDRAAGTRRPARDRGGPRRGRGRSTRRGRADPRCGLGRPGPGARPRHAGQRSPSSRGGWTQAYDDEMAAAGDDQLVGADLLPDRSPSGALAPGRRPRSRRARRGWMPRPTARRSRRRTRRSRPACWRSPATPGPRSLRLPRGPRGLARPRPALGRGADRDRHGDAARSRRGRASRRPPARLATPSAGWARSGSRPASRRRWGGRTAVTAPLSPGGSELGADLEPAARRGSGRSIDLTLAAILGGGEVPERLNGPVLKTGGRKPRGFESHPLRQIRTSRIGRFPRCRLRALAHAR